VLESLTQPAWVCRVIEHIRAAHSLTAVVLAGAPARREPLAARLFHRIDRAIYGRRKDGLTACDAGTLLRGVKTAAAITAGDADVVLALAPFDAPDLEVWRVEQSGLWEFATRQPLLRGVLRSGTRVIGRTSAMPDAISYRRAMSRLGMRVAAMIEHELDRRARRCDAPAADEPPRVEREVSSARMLAAGLSSARGWVEQQFRDRFVRGQWRIGIAFGASDPLRIRDFHPIVPPDDRFWADPFVVREAGGVWIFFEELVYAEDRGVICALEVHADGTPSQPVRVLERPYHLSYPCMFRWNGTLYMLPETEGNRTIEVYRCNEFPHRWELEKVVMSGVNAVDTTVFEAHGRWWMFYATDSGDAAGFDRLWIHHAPSPLGPWTAHRWNPLECNVIGGRPAGLPFVRDGKLLRATQVGAPWYGHSMRIREIVTLTPDAWEEREVAKIQPDWMPGLSGTHTLNVVGDVVVMDGLRRRLARP